jgi:hypothetical protein
MDETRDPPRRGWTKNHGWLETPDGDTVADRAGAAMDRAAERISPTRHPDWWDRYTFGTTAPARPPGYDMGVPAIFMLTSMLLFFWVPILNAFIGGCLGGWRARSMRRALGATALTLLALVPLLWAAGRIDPIFNPLFGLGMGGYLLVTALSLLLGAWTGASCRWAIREEQSPVKRWVAGPWAMPRRRDYVRG